jgi:hypothetical protein
MILIIWWPVIRSYVGWVELFARPNTVIIVGSRKELDPTYGLRVNSGEST